MSELVLSCFPGIGLLDMAFEEQGYCVVRGPDVLWGGDICNFHPPAGVFDGVIGGPPCQCFSSIARFVRGRGYETKFGNLIPEFERVVSEAKPRWFLMENVIQAPMPVLDGYTVRDQVLDNRWLGEDQRRRRRFSFGTKEGFPLLIDVALFESPIIEYPVTGNGGGIALCGLTTDRGKPRPKRTVEAVREAAKRPWAKLCELQGLSPEFLEDSPFTKVGKQKALGNAVPLPMGRAIAKAVKKAMEDA